MKFANFALAAAVFASGANAFTTSAKPRFAVQVRFGLGTPRRT